MKISKDAENLIIASEVTGKSTYEKKYQRPEWPKGNSGITIGIGYDCGYSTAAQIRKDWGGRIPDSMIDVLATQAAKITGSAAQKRLAAVRQKVNVPWDAAISEFEEVEIPKWISIVEKALPNTEMLSPDCLGSIVSLTYNRGAGGYSPKGQLSRFKEMRTIWVAMRDQNFNAIPKAIRDMKRLWAGTEISGVVARREQEARLFEKGLRSISQPIMSDPSDEKNEIPDWLTNKKNTSPVLTSPMSLGDPEIFSIQSRLKSMNYSPGRLDGKWGGATAGAISAFLNDRNDINFSAPTSLESFNEVKSEITLELQKAESEGFVRPVSQARAEADPKVVAEIAPEVEPAKKTFLATLWGSIATAFTAAFDSVSGYVKSAWDFWTDNKDSVPDGDAISPIFSYLSSVPVSVWLVIIATVLGVLAYLSGKSVKAITESVKSGARQ